MRMTAPDALAVECLTCLSRAGSPCSLLDQYAVYGWRYAKKPHAARIKAAEQRKEEGT